MLKVVVDKQARAEVTSGLDELFRVIMQDGGLAIPRLFPDRLICMAQERWGLG